ncbi:hypothetical protein I316_05242 [Kwoniella heveanensis BCC8398]|uniref:Ricin B lectin domain-containing protein n=1 Tax=Kwoniella heveanensis BCC8398 TaxID=1296120 RepID=A0A1B9GQB5_9TREE|nr:hypothetical protein I316_05242 [Kwoniella heveanensis BCC8398]
MLYLAALLPFLAVTFALPQSEVSESSSAVPSASSTSSGISTGSLAASSSGFSSAGSSSASASHSGSVPTSASATLSVASGSSSSIPSGSTSASASASAASATASSAGNSTISATENSGNGEGIVDRFIGVKVQSLVNGLCLSPDPSVPLTELKTGIPIGVYPCDDAQKWDFNPESTAMIVSSTNFALDVDQQYNDGAHLSLLVSITSNFYITNDARIAITNQGYCIDQKKGSSSEVQLWKCADENTNQMWIVVDGETQRLIVNPKAAGEDADASDTSVTVVAAQNPPSSTASGHSSTLASGSASTSASGSSSTSASSGHSTSTALTSASTSHSASSGSASTTASQES